MEDKLGLKCGIEIHQQLSTLHKLFCNCAARLSADRYSVAITRKLRPVAGETGMVDRAAQFEKTKGMEYQYFSYPLENCLVETDDEPPHAINPEALEAALKVALMLNCEIPEEIQVMRKTVVDGSNTSGFQRTALIGLKGWIKTTKGRVGIANVCIEEDSSQIVRKETKRAVYGLDRLGIPLIEIGTEPDIRDPQQAREAAEHIGMVLQSTGSAKKGLGTIRQDLNVSIKDGNRVEIKGVQRLGMIPGTIEAEMKRQEALLKNKKKVESEVRKALPTGATEFLRPMAGSARMYPETDIPPIPVDPKYVTLLKRKLPELIADKTKRLAKTGLNEELLTQLKKAGYLDLFDSLSRTFDPKAVATVLTSLVKQIKTEGHAVEKLTHEHFEEMFSFLRTNPLPKEGVLELLKNMAKEPEKPVKELAGTSGMLTETDIRKIVKKVISSKKELLGQHNADKMLMGLVMKEVRGKASGALVMKILKEEM
ncbi:MAG: Glu-tRNA(Gln) amidotransferase subunit GatE [Candidatus Aenigmatarchaeota archaeon]